MSNNWYPASDLTGGTTGCLDYIDGTDLNDGDRAFVITDDEVIFFILDSDSAETEDSPEIISPDTNAGDKRWIQIPTYDKTVLMLTAATSDGGTDTLLIKNTSNTHPVLPDDVVWKFTINLIATQGDGTAGTVGDTAFWTITGGIKRDDSDNLALIGTPQGTGTPTTTDRDVGAAAWSVAVTANDTYKALHIVVTGESNKDISWEAKMDFVELTYVEETPS